MTANRRRPQLDRMPTRPVELSILASATVSSVEVVEFKILKSSLQVNDSLLSEYIFSLESVGYVEVAKACVTRYSRISIRATDRGHTTLGEHIPALCDIFEFVPKGEQCS